MKRSSIVTFILVIAFQFSATIIQANLMTPSDNQIALRSSKLESFLHNESYRPSYHQNQSQDSKKTLLPLAPLGTKNGGNNLLNSSYPMFCHDTRHTSLSPYNTSNMPPVIKWRIRTNVIDGGIAIDKNGTLYFGSWDDNVWAVYPNGTVKWRRDVNMFVSSTPAIAPNGTIYVGCENGYLNAIYPNGTVQWGYNCGYLDFIIQSSPVIADDGTIYIGTMYNLYAINPDGSKKWVYYLGHDVYSSPVLALDGTIIFGCWDNYIYALNPNGTLRWRYQTGDHVMGPGSIAADGTVYYPSWDGYLYALNPTNGSLIWRVAIKWGSESNPAIGPDGTIYVGESYYYAINPNGTIRWSYNVGGAIHWSSPSLSQDGIIYFGVWTGDGTQGGDILALNSNGTLRWRQRIDWHACVDGSTAISEDGTVYIGTHTGYLYAFGRGPIIIDANGPYNGNCGSAIQFSGTVWGGMPPYSYLWDFGDGTTSDIQSPKHNYTTVGNFTATFTVTDSEGNSSYDTASVHITYSLPTVSIIKPTKGVYIMNTRLIPLPNRCAIIGPITIEVNASEIPLGIDRVEFSIDGKLKSTDTEAPYSWIWSLGFFKHTITVTAYDSVGDKATASIQVFKLL
jgi:large repetitive protein